MAIKVDDTIAAIATPLGRGGISTVRVSGKNALSMAMARMRSAGDEFVPRQAKLGRFFDAQGCFLDQVVCLFFRAPDSYTGEDVVEISCHGSPVISRTILETCLQSGARLAEPGEFTLRAFLHGKMDLTQAEAVRDLVESQTRFQAQLAAEQVNGQLSEVLQPMKEKLVAIISEMETSMEFVEEAVETASKEEWAERLAQLEVALQQLEDTYSVGKVIRDGIKVVLAGRSNTGKSSLFNSLVAYERAIVTARAGTTRDALTEWIELEGVPVLLVDTAGIHEATIGLVERLGVEKTLRYAGEADLLLFVVDGAEGFRPEDEKTWQEIQALPCLLVINKMDLPLCAVIPEKIRSRCRGEVAVSALEGTNLDQLRKEILAAVLGESRVEKEQFTITNLRQHGCLQVARRQVGEGRTTCALGESEEIPLYHLKRALQAVDELTGVTSTQDILGEIFSTFCIGK